MLTATDSDVIGMLWSKTAPHGADSTPHSLLAHLLDTAAVAELVWDRFLAAPLRDRLDAATQGHGRQLLALLAGAHDIGKASPVFQGMSEPVYRNLHDRLPDLAPLPLPSSQYHRHTLVGGYAVPDLLGAHGQSEHGDWIAGVVGGHHGHYAPRGEYSPRGISTRILFGGAGWQRLRQLIFDDLTAAVLPDLATVRITEPSLADQVILCGAVIMADWVASNESAFPYIWGRDPSIGEARERASAAWERLGLGLGWRGNLPLTEDVIRARFPEIAEPRPLQVEVERSARDAQSPPLIIVEAAMGEGKTEAALAAAEVLAARFKLDGILFGLPTQATADAMSVRVEEWARRLPPVPVKVVHGGAALNPVMQRLRPWSPQDRPEWSASCIGDGCGEESHAAPEWFSGSKRRLLTPIVVGTVDNVLRAGARVQHVALRHLALSNKVVILDEVHSADTHMYRYLAAALSWLGQARVPVVLLSATLSTAQRRELVRAYSGSEVPDLTGYPAVTVAGDGPVRTTYPSQGRPDQEFELTVLDEELTDSGEAEGNAQVAELLSGLLSDGGCALVVRNTVARAQRLARYLRGSLADTDVVLLHSRFTAADRNRITESVQRHLGRGDGVRPHRYVLVSTQVAEQSLDIDADVLITDLAPVDVLLQRCGRTHRHDHRPSSTRPERLRTPRVYVTRMHGLAVPELQSGGVYAPALLLRTAAVVRERTRVTLPADIPGLVSAVYDHTGDGDPVLGTYDGDYEVSVSVASHNAGNGALRQPTEVTSVHGLTGSAPDVEESGLGISVRNGVESVEVVLLVRYSDGELRFSTGEPVDGNRSLVTALGSVVRMPQSLTRLARGLDTVPELRDTPQLRRYGALVMDEDMEVRVRGYMLMYDSLQGLTYERSP